MIHLTSPANRLLIGGLLAVGVAVLAWALLVLPVAATAVPEPAVAESPELTIDGAPVTEEIVAAESVIEPAEEPVDESADESAIVSASTEADTPVLPAPALSTDKADYRPGETVTIFGRFFRALQTIFLKIFGGTAAEDNYLETTAEITADESGSFTFLHPLDDIFRPLYTIVASDETGTELAQATFTDGPNPSVGEYSQCTNDAGTGYATGNDGCRWTHGAINKQNSRYYEGDATPQRLHLTDLVNGSHSIKLSYGTTKGGKHAYDFLTDDTFSEDWMLAADLCEGLSGFSGCASLTPQLFAIPADPLAGGFDTATSGRRFKIRNGIITNVSAPAMASGNYASDSETEITVTFSVDTATCADKKTVQGVETCPVLISWGGHISRQADWGAGQSAVNIQGAPYHIELKQLDGSSVGQRDNQMQASAVVVPGTVTIIKTASGGDATFSYSGSLGLTSLTTVGGTASSSFGLAPGSYTVTETDPESAPGGWSFSNLVCSDPDNGTSVNLSTRTATVDVDEGENIVCTFTNEKRGTIIVEKQTDPDGAAGTFTFTGAAAGTISDNGQITVSNLPAGTYTATENDPGPAFLLTDISCDDGASATPSLTSTSTRTATFKLDPGETVKCVFTNTRQTGTVIIVKQTTGGDGAFNFTTAGGGNLPGAFTATTSGGYATSTFTGIIPGAYSVAETVPAGWDLTGAVCTSGTPAAFTLSPGGTVTCIFTNVKRGTIVVIKDAIPNDPQDFTFNNNFGAGHPAVFLLDDDSNATLPNNRSFQVPAGSGYSVTEEAIAGWKFSGVVCGNGLATTTDSTNLTVGSNETLTCKFTNRKLATIVVVKQTTGGDGAFNFTTAGGGNLPGAFTATTSGGYATSTFTNIDPDNTYSVAEAVPAGWDLTGVSCKNENNVAKNNTGFTLNAGGTVTCTFANVKRGRLIVEKTTDPAGDGTVFTIVATGSGLISGSATGTVTDALDYEYEVIPGVYSVAETVPAGWDLTGNTCQAVAVAAGETKTCQLTNIKLARLRIIKDAQPNDLIDFEFGGSLNQFFLDDDEGVDGADNILEKEKLFTGLVPGAYTVTEILPNSFWTLAGVACVDAAAAPFAAAATTSGVTVTLAAGDDVTCTFTNEKQNPTRTQGFWQTHREYTASVLAAAPLSGSMIIGDGAAHKGPVDTIGKIFGAFWSNIAKKTDNKQRSAVDKTRMQLLQQLVAAKLNCAAFGCTADVQTMITAADAAYAAGNIGAILTSAGLLDAYNNSGDTLLIGPAGKADPKGAQQVADKAFWDNP